MTSFSDLGLSPETVQAVTDTGYTTPTPIQEQAIPVALAGRDVLGIAQTGTGKTAAFTLPMIDKLAAGRSKARMPRSLVIAPTRELADQVAASFDKYAKGRKLTWALLIGGVSMDEQVKKLDRGVDVLIATPGRLLDLFERGRMLLTGVQIMVVDEADRMLDMGFIPDIERIFKMTPANKQTLFFSATMPPEITRLTKQFLKDPTRIEATPPATTATTISQHMLRVPSSDPKAKRAALRAIVAREEVQNGIVFCNRKSEVDVVAKSLRTHGFDAAPIHGDLDQSTRTRTLESFRNGGLKLLVASDVAARGLDIPAVSHVFNYDVPHHAEDYVHRIGRTGRAGRKGDTYMLVTPSDAKGFDKVVKLIGQTPDEVKLDIDYGNLGEDRSRSSRDKGRSSSSSRSRGRDPEAAANAAVEVGAAPAPEAAEIAMEPPARLEREPSRSRSRRPSRDERPAPRESQPASSIDEANRGRDDRTARDERPSRDVQPAREVRPARQDLQAAPRREPETAFAAGRPERDASDRIRGNRRDEDDRGVVGFGSDIPAFLRR